MNELSDHKSIGENLAPEEEQRLVDLGALGWPPEDIARSINANVEQFTQEYNDPNSRVAVLIARGLLQKRALLEIRLMDEALGGNIPATTQLYKVQRDRSFEMTKLDVFGGFTDEQSYQRIMDYIDKGCEDDLSAKEQLYIDLLNLVFSLSKQHDRRNVIKFLTKPPFKLSYARAVDIYDEAVNLFYSNRRVTKEALRQKYADDLEAWSSIVAQRATWCRRLCRGGRHAGKGRKNPPSRSTRPGTTPILTIYQTDSSSIPRLFGCQPPTGKQRRAIAPDRFRTGTGCRKKTSAHGSGDRRCGFYRNYQCRTGRELTPGTAPASTYNIRTCTPK